MFAATDEGENLDESVGLAFSYDSTHSSPKGLELTLSALRMSEDCPISLNHLSFALLGALESHQFLGLIKLRPVLANFFARSGERVYVLDLLTKEADWYPSSESGPTYSFFLDRERPLFSYSFSGHKELEELSLYCSFCPMDIVIDGAPMIESPDGFLQSHMLLLVDASLISPKAVQAGNPVWVPHQSEISRTNQTVRIPRRRSSRDGRPVRPNWKGEGGQIESNFYQLSVRSKTTCIFPVVDGVTMNALTIDSLLKVPGWSNALPYTAIVACSQVRTDFSHSRVVKDQHLRAVVASVKEQASRFSIALGHWVSQLENS